MPLFRTRLRVLRAEREVTGQVGPGWCDAQTINCIEKGRFHPNLRLAFKLPAPLETDRGSVYLRGYLKRLGRLTRYPRTGIIT